MTYSQTPPTTSLRLLAGLTMAVHVQTYTTAWYWGGSSLPPISLSKDGPLPGDKMESDPHFLSSAPLRFCTVDGPPPAALYTYSQGLDRPPVLLCPIIRRISVCPCERERGRSESCSDSSVFKSVMHPRRTGNSGSGGE